VSIAAGRYVGIPYAERGASVHGCNCWGLVHLVLKEQFGVTTPDYAEHSGSEVLSNARAFQEAAGSLTWLRVTHPRAGDCALMTAMTDGERSRRVPGHVGIMIDSKTVLHVWEATAACLMPLDHARLRTRILGFYRHRDLA